jgi:hypothetical protein
MARKAKATATRKSKKTPPTAKKRLIKKRLAKNGPAKKRLTKKRPAKKRPTKKRAPKKASPSVETLNAPVAPARRAGLRRRARAELAPPPGAAALSIIDQITALAARSKIAKYGCKDDGGKESRPVLVVGEVAASRGVPVHLLLEREKPAKP